jgi:hypothetical protein
LKFEGIYTPAITPLGPEGQIDRDGFAAVLEQLIEAKVHGIIVGGSTGEYYAQTAQERFDLAAYARQVIGSRLPLIVGIPLNMPGPRRRSGRTPFSSPPRPMPCRRSAKMRSTPLPSTAPPTCRSCSTTTPPAWV